MAMHFNIADMFEQVADAVPEREALICGDSRRTYRQLDERATRLAHFLASQGVGAGDNVGLYMYNCNEYLESVLACFKIRAVPINVNYRYVRDELQYLIDNACMVAMIHGREFIPHIAEVRGAVPKLHTCIAVEDGSQVALEDIGAFSYEDSLAQSSAVRDFGERSDDDLFILYTGGTTGMPKGVMWPHRNVFFAAMGGGGHYSALGACQTPEDIVSRICATPLIGIALAPLMHGASWWFACIQLLAGNTVVLNPHRHLKGEQVWDIVERERCMAVQLVGDAMAIPLLDALEANPGRWELSCVFNVGSGGAVFSESKQAAFRRHFPNCFITNSFGSSESGQMGIANGQHKTEGGLGNVARSDFMDVIIEDETPMRRAKPGETGIFARSGHIPIGYFNDPVKTAKTFVEVEGKRWILTGDAAKLEEDLTISVFGRGSNCINSGGEKIFPEEVEQALKAHPDIFDALVVGTPDPRWGEKVTAVVALRDGRALTLASLQEAARQHVAGYKVPREVHVVPHIPREPNGKPNYREARRIALESQHPLG